jgi:hypothetical protein
MIILVREFQIECHEEFHAARLGLYVAQKTSLQCQEGPVFHLVKVVLVAS